MPEEIFFIVITALIGGCTLTYSIVRMAINYHRDKYGIGKGKGNSPSLTTSELGNIVRSAVEEAISPLDERLAMLEHQLEASKESKQLHSGISNDE